LQRENQGEADAMARPQLQKRPTKELITEGVVS
jgi:hypothetical protein